MVLCGVAVAAAAVLVCGGGGGGVVGSPVWTGSDRFIMDYVHHREARSLHFLHLPHEDDAGYTAMVRSVIFRMAKMMTFRICLISRLEQTAAHLLQRGQQGAPLLVAPLLTPRHARFLSQVVSEAWAQRYQWLLLGRQESLHLLHQLFLPHNNQVQVASVGTNSSQVELWEQYQVAAGLRRHLHLVGRWDPAPAAHRHHHAALSDSSRGRTKRDEWGTFLMYKYSRVPDMTGLYLRCLSEEWPPFTFVEYLPGGGARVSGVLQELWTILQHRLNFTYECRRSPDGEWGTQRENGSWTGMIGELVAGRADLVLGSADQTSDRSRVVHYSHPLVTSTFRLLVRRVRNPVTGWSSFSMELSWGSWVALVGVVATSCLILAAILRCADRRHPTSEAPLLVLGLLCHQGYPKAVCSTSERLVAWTVSVLGVVTLAHYSSVMISSLALTRHTNPISSMRDILTSDTYSFGLVRGTSTEAMFKDSSVALYREVWQEAVAQRQQNLVPSIPAGVHRAATHNYIFLIDENIYNFRYWADCRLMVVGPRYFRLPSTLIFRKGLPYTHIFDQELAKMAEMGLMDREYSKWRKRTASCDVATVHPVDLGSMFTALLLLLGGILVSLLLLLLENTVRWLGRGSRGHAPGPSQPPALQPLFYKTSKIRRRKYH